MWFHGTTTLQRARQYKFQSPGKTRASWERPTAPYGVGPLTFDPYKFAYATARSSIVGQKIGLRGQLAGLGLGAASLAFLEFRAPSDLLLHKNFWLLKDFVGTSLRGTIGAAVAYIEMLDQGYVWQGHWEDCVASAVKGPHPDFIFANSNSVCLLDAKGTTRLPIAADSMAKSEWRRQIYPNRSVSLKGGGPANEGRVVATLLSKKNAAEMVSAIGSWNTTTSAKPPVGPSPGTVAAVQRANFIDAFFLLGFANLAWGLLGYKNHGSLHQGSASEMTLRNEAVYVGPIRMTLTINDEPWAMHPFCKKRIVDAAITSVAETGRLQVGLPVFSQGLAQTTVDGSSPITFVDGPDGVGAVFRKMERFEG